MFSLEINIKSQEHGGRTREQRVMLTAEVSESSVISRRTDEEASEHMSDESDNEQSRALNSEPEEEDKESEEKFRHDDGAAFP